MAGVLGRDNWLGWKMTGQKGFESKYEEHFGDVAFQADSRLLMRMSTHMLGCRSLLQMRVGRVNWISVIRNARALNVQMVQEW